MQFFKISLSQVIVAGLLVTSAAGAPLPLSGDLAIRDDFSVAGVNAHLDARDPSKIGRWFKKAFNKVKPIVSTVAGAVLKREPETAVEIEARDPSKVGRWFKKAFNKVKPIVSTVAGAVLKREDTAVEIEARDPSKVGRWFKKAFNKVKPIVSTVAGAVLKREPETGVEIGKRDVEDSLMARDVDESAEYAEAADDESADELQARDVHEHWE